VEANVYENWTDVTGIMSADPRVIENPHAVHYISYRELRELSYMGASVLHEDAIFPLKNTGIPIRVCNTMEPEKEGTWIVARYPVDRGSHPVTGIAGKKGFSNLQIEMAMMNTQIGFGARILEIVANHGISYEHTPTSIDIMSVIADTKAMDPHRNELIMEIDQEFHPDRIFIEEERTLGEAALGAARLRLRPILMTAFAFIIGVLPLVFASGAYSEARNIVGVSLVGGMLVATLLGIFVYPSLYYLVGRVAKFERRREKIKQESKL
jgi:aspartate kinase